MKISSFFICSLIVFSPLIVCDDAEDRAQWNEIVKSEFGKGIVESLELKNQEKGSSDFLIDFLYSIDNTLKAEQKDDDAYIKDKRLECEKNEKRTKTDVAQLEQRISEIKQELEEKVPIRDEKTNLLKDKKAQQAQIEERINEIDAAREEKDEEWRSIAEEHDKATYIVENGRLLLENGYSETGFLEKKHKKGDTVFTQLSFHIKSNTAELNFSKQHWNHSFKVLASLADSLEPTAESNEKILQLFNVLQDKIADSRELARREYDGWVAEYEETKARETKKLGDVVFDVNLLTTQVSKLNKSIRELSDDKDDKNKVHRQKKNELKDQVQYCDREADNYGSRRTTRRNNLNVVSDAIVLVNSNWRLIKQMLSK